MTLDEAYSINQRSNESDDDSWSLVEKVNDSCRFKLVEVENGQNEDNMSVSLGMELVVNAADSEGRRGTFYGRVLANGVFCCGTMIYHRGTKPFRMFRGNWRSDNTFQSGLLVYSNDNVYSGEFDRQNKPHGEGRYIEKSGRYEYDGEWDHDLQNGQGCEKILNPTTGKTETYTGEFEGGLRHGIGACKYANGTIYSGGWYQSRRHHVKGTLFDSSGGSLRTCKWENDNKHEAETGTGDFPIATLEIRDNELCDADSLDVMAPIEECESFNAPESIHLAIDDLIPFSTN